MLAQLMHSRDGGAHQPAKVYEMLLETRTTGQTGLLRLQAIPVKEILISVEKENLITIFLKNHLFPTGRIEHCNNREADISTKKFR